MYTTALTRGFPLLLRSPLSLERLLSAYHIPIVDHSLARAHKRDTVLRNRDGIYRFIGPVLYALSVVLTFLLSDRHISKTVTGLVAYGTIVLIALFAAPSLASIQPIAAAISWAGLAAFIVLFIHFFITMAASVDIRFFEYAEASAIWDRRPVTDAHGNMDLSFVPGHLHDRIKRASQIPDAEVQIERFGFDPLILVTRRIGLVTQTVYIGGWDTGNPKIDKA